MLELCPPALIYVVFSLTQIIIDTIKGLYNTSLIKFIVMIMITILLNALCQGGLGVVSWIIVFIPFVMMTVITSVLLYIFGLNAATGTFYNKNTNNVKQNVYTDTDGNIIIYDPYYDAKNKPVYYNYPNVIVPSPPQINNTTTQNNPNIVTQTNTTTITTPFFTNLFNSTSPAFTWM